VDEVRTQPSFRDAAHRLQASFASAGGAPAAADALEKLVADRGLTTEPVRPDGHDHERSGGWP
jgi:UDP:flavonoid glycosyltransferase YjiC (YdhE family)